MPQIPPDQRPAVKTTRGPHDHDTRPHDQRHSAQSGTDRKSTRLNSSHSQISYAVFCLKKKKNCTVLPVSSLLCELLSGSVRMRACGCRRSCTRSGLAELLAPIVCTRSFDRSYIRTDAC